jgi:DNA-binding MarR family transcriptional regulator
MAKSEDDDAPDAAASLRQLSRLSSLWRAADFDHGLNPVQWETLRFLKMANRFSRTPGALTKYLGATKGTTSQTLQSLTKKGLVSKQAHADDQRSVTLALTAQAMQILELDQRRFAETALEALKPKAQKRFAQVLDALVRAEALRLGVQSFGACGDCSYFRQGKKDEASHCMRFEVKLEADEENLLCFAHQVR